MHSLFTADELTLEYPIIYGISSGVKPVRLGYALNSCSSISVFSIDDILNYSKESAHVCYEITHLDDSRKSLIIKNKGTNGFFYKKYRSIDYLLCSCDEEEIAKEIINIVGKLREVSVCFALNQPSQKEILNFSQLL